MFSRFRYCASKAMPPPHLFAKQKGHFLSFLQSNKPFPKSFLCKTPWSLYFPTSGQGPRREFESGGGGAKANESGGDKATFTFDCSLLTASKKVGGGAWLQVVLAFEIASHTSL